MPAAYTVKQVADILGYSTNSIYAFLKAGRIKGVRMGKGRFRIPAAELSRILSLSKKATLPQLPVVDLAPAESHQNVAIGVVQSVNRNFFLEPDIFDWFIGLGALVSGISLFLFNASVVPAEAAGIPLAFPIIRIVLMACGIGIIVSSMTAGVQSWHRMFHLGLFIMGILNAYGLARSADMQGAFWYGGLAIIIGITNIVHFRGVLSLGLYISLVALLYPAAHLFFPEDLQAQALSAVLGLSPVVIGSAFLVVGLLLSLAFWWGYAGNRGLLLVATLIAAACDIAIAVWYAHLMYWSRAFFLVIFGYFTALIPHWLRLEQEARKRYKLMMHGFFLGIGVIMVLAIFVVYLLQQSVWLGREKDFLNKIQIAQNTLTSAVTSVRSSLVVASGNKEFVEAVVQKHLPGMNTSAKIIYESNPDIRRLVFLDRDGNGTALYPYGTFDEPNFAYRDYYKQPKSTGQPFISEVFRSKADKAGRYVVVVAVPLYDKGGEFAGVLAASLDLDRLGLQLAQIENAESGEYFLITDEKGVIFSHPNLQRIGTSVPETDPVRLGLRGEAGVHQSLMMNKSVGMIAYAGIPALRWGISLRTEANNIFELSSMAIWSVFGTVSAALLVSIVLFALIRGRISVLKESGA